MSDALAVTVPTEADMAVESSWATTEALSAVVDHAPGNPIFRHWWLPYLMVLMMTVLVASIPGNVLTIIACIKYKELRSPAHLLIINQSLTDLMSAFAGINLAAPVFVHFIRPKYYCLFSLVSIFVGLETSVLNLMAITIDRFVAVVFTFRYYTWVTSHRVTVAICLVWAITVSVHLTPFMGWNRFREGVSCQSVHVLNSLYINLFFIFPILISLLLTAISNVVIGVIALRKSRKVGDVEDKTKALQTKTQLKVTKMLLMVVGTFYFCWMPYIVVSSIFRSPPSSWRKTGIPEEADLMFLLSQIFVVFSAFLNPLIYAYKDMAYRRAYCKLLGIHLTQLDTQSTST